MHVTDTSDTVSKEEGQCMYEEEDTCMSQIPVILSQGGGTEAEDAGECLLTPTHTHAHTHTHTHTHTQTHKS